MLVICGRERSEYRAQTHSHMKKILIPYGRKQLSILVSRENIMAIIYPRETERKDDCEILAQAIEQPLGRHTLAAFIKRKGSLLVIANDATRPTKTSVILDMIENKIKREHTHFLIATGAHRVPKDSELQVIFGRHYGQYADRILIHDSKNQSAMQYFGNTRYGTELWLNKCINQFDKILVIGSVEPHYFAGYTGGRKSFLPGIAAYCSIEQNHRFALHPKAQPFSLDGNPVHEEMLDCMNALDLRMIFSVQMVLDRNHNIFEAFTGPLDKTFEMASQYAREIYAIKIPAKADIVVTVAQRPFDVNLYQTLKALEHGKRALRDKGILIVVSPCDEGIGPEGFARLFKDQKTIECAAQNSTVNYRLGDHNAANLWSLARHSQIWALTNIPDAMLNNAHIRAFHSLQLAITQAIRRKGASAKILFLMNGSMTVPVPC